MTTRRSFLSTLAVSLALCRFRLPPAEASLGTAPPMESLIVKGQKFTHDSQLWKYLRYKRLTFLNCEFVDVLVKGRLWSFEHCRFTESYTHLDYLDESIPGVTSINIDHCLFIDQPAPGAIAITIGSEKRRRELRDYPHRLPAFQMTSTGFADSSDWHNGNFVPKWFCHNSNVTWSSPDSRVPHSAAGLS